MLSLPDYAESLHALHELWQPLPWQIPFGQALFHRGIKDIGAQCGRSSGKTELASYCAWRWARMNPGSETYIIEPLFNQAREILWASNRIQSFGPQSWIESVNNTECRIVFTNRSFIKLEGSENTEKLRGIKPRGLIIWDELKDIRPQTIDAMDPNRARYDVPAIYLGTPPEFENHYIEIMGKLQNNKKAFWTRVGSHENNYNSQEWLDNKKKELIESGQEDVWLREYCAIFVKGGKRAIFPQASKYHYPNLDTLIPKDLNHWWLFVIADPGSTSVFAVGFFLFNPYQKRLIAVDEVYETKMENMRVRFIRDQIKEKLKAWEKIKEIRFAYDCAAAWFMNEMSEVEPKWWWTPVDKTKYGKEDGITFIRDLFQQARFDIASNCIKMRWELENYAKDDNGRIPKINDHLIDIIRYTIQEAGLDLKETDPPKPPDPDTEKRGHRMEDDIDFGLSELEESDMTEL